MQLSASQYTFSSSAMHSLTIILQDSRYSSLLDDIEEGMITAFLSSSSLILSALTSDSHIYFRR